MADNGSESKVTTALHIFFTAFHSADFNVQLEGELTANQMRAIAGWLMTEAEMLHVAAKQQAVQAEAQRRIQVPGTTIPRDLRKVS